MTQKKLQSEIQSYFDEKNAQKYTKRGVQWEAYIGLRYQYLHLKFLQQPFS